MKKILPLLLLILLSCNSKNKSDALTADNARLDSLKRADSIAVVASTPVEETEPTNWSTPVADISGPDTLFNILARKKIVRGTFGGVEVVTNKLLDASTLGDSRNLLAVLVLSGEGEGYTTQFATEYSILAVFEQRDGQVTLVDFVDLGETTSYGLREMYTEADSIMLAENRFAAMIHNKSSEEGAGDSGYRIDFVELYILLNNKLTKVFERTIDDFGFVSNESDSYYEHTITTAITVLTEKTNGLFNLQVSTTGEERGSDDEEGQGEEPAEEETKAGGDGVFRWNGKEYEKVMADDK